MVVIADRAFEYFSQYFCEVGSGDDRGRAIHFCSIFCPLSLSLALSIIVYPCDKKKLRSHGQPSVASRRFFIGKRRKDAKRSNLLGHFRSRPLGHADTLSILTFFSKMDGESRKGKMIEDPLEEDPCCSVFFSAKICSLNGINDKMAFHSIDSLFNKFFEFLYVIALLCISSVWRSFYLDFTWR